MKNNNKTPNPLFEVRNTNGCIEINLIYSVIRDSVNRIPLNIPLSVSLNIFVLLAWLSHSKRQMATIAGMSLGTASKVSTGLTRRREDWRLLHLTTDIDFFPGLLFETKTPSAKRVMMIRPSWDCLIFMMGICILVRHPTFASYWHGPCIIRSYILVAAEYRRSGLVRSAGSL